MTYCYAPEETAIVLVEMQPEIVRTSETVSQDRLARAMIALDSAADVLAVPIFASGVTLSPDEEPQLIDELASHELLVRQRPAVLDDPAISEKIKATGRKILAIGGVSSEMAILHTVHSALVQGYEVHLLVDACGGLNERTEQAAFQQAQAAGAKLSSVSSFLVGFIRDQNDDAGKKVFGIIGKLGGWANAPS